MPTTHHHQSTVPGRAPGAVLRRGLRQRLRASAGHAAAAIAATRDTTSPDLHRPIAAPSAPRMLQVSGGAMLLSAALLIALLLQVTLISQLRHERDQSLLYDQFRFSLADGTAPVGQIDRDGELLPLGTAVAVLRIPELGVDEVVVEGTTSRTMLAAPGHRRDTVLPGQAGASVVMGRQASYGGALGGIQTLERGDTIETTTGQGVARYRVTGIRLPGDPQPAPPAAGEGRLTLVTAGGTPFAPDSVVRVDAELLGDPYPTPVPVLRVGSLTEAEAANASDPSGWLPLLLLLELGAVAVFAGALALRRWGRWHTWIVAVPVVLVIGLTIGEQVVVLLPNLT